MASVPFNNLITFSRGSNATVTGPTGLVQWAPNNLVTFSEQFDNAAWVKNNSVVTTNVAVAPDGSTTADRVVAATTGNARGVYALVTTTANIHTISVYAKAAGLNWFCIYDPAGSAAGVAWFNLSTGAVGTVASGYTAAIVDAGNGWYRCSITRLLAAGTNFPFFGGVNDDNTPTVTSTVNGVLVWGAQLELGSAATTYNSTTVKNLLGFSEAFDNAAWTKVGSSIVTGAQANPVNGAFNAQKLMEDTALSGHQALQTVVTTANPWTFSVFVKAGGRNWTALGITDSSSTVRITYFDLVNGVVGTVATGITASIVAAGNGWYRCAVRVASAVAGNNNLRVYATLADGTTAYTGDGNSGVYIYGAQLSDSASLDAYVPTPAAAPSSTAYYGPRFDYDPVTLQPKGLLVEEARTNLFTYSEQFDNAAWAKGVGYNSTISANTAVAPDGTTTADSVVADNAGGAGTVILARSVSITSGTSYTLTFFAKANTLSWIRLFALGYTSPANGGAYFNLSGAGAVGTVDSGYTASITAFANGWYRCTLSFTAGSTVTGELRLLLANANNDTAVARNGTSSVYAWGAQLEAGAFATSYIPTVASTVTRSADVATINGSLFSQWYGQAEGSWVSSFTPYVVPGGVVAQISAATNTDRFQLLCDNTGQIAVSTNNVGQGTIDAGTVAAGATNKLAYAYRTNDTAASLNGGAIGTDTTVTLPVVDRLCLGATVAPAGFLNGHIRSVNFIPARAADFQLQALTT